MAESDLPRTSLLNKYRDSVQELQDTLIKEKKWRQDAESENRVLRKKNLEIEEHITDFRYSTVEYMTKIEEICAENKKLLEKNKDLTKELQRIEEMLERQQVRADTLEKELEKMEESENKMKSDLSENQRIVSELKNSLIGLEEKLKLEENDKFQYKEEVFVYKNAYKEIEAEFNVKNKECAELYENFKIIDEENNKFRQNEAWILENQQTLERKTQQLIEDERKLTQGYKNKYNSANETIESLSNQLEKLQKSFENLNEEKTLLSSKFANLKIAKDDLEKIFDSKTSELEKNLSFAEDQYQSSLSAKEKAIQNLSVDCKNLSEKVEISQKENSRLKNKANESLIEMNEIKSELHAKNQIIFDISNKNKELLTQVQTLAETIEQEKVKFAKEISAVNKKNEKNLNLMILALKNDHEAELSQKRYEIEEATKKYFESLEYLKEKEEENININSDREKLQDMIRELDGKLREILTKIHSDSISFEALESHYLQEKQLRQSLENKSSTLSLKIKEIEAEYLEEIHKLNEKISGDKLQIKEAKKKYSEESDSKIKIAEETLNYWKEKFREEIGYLEKWAQSIESDSHMQTVHSRLFNICKRLTESIEQSTL